MKVTPENIKNRTDKEARIAYAILLFLSGFVCGIALVILPG